MRAKACGAITSKSTGGVARGVAGGIVSAASIAGASKAATARGTACRALGSEIDFNLSIKHVNKKEIARGRW